VPYPGIVQDVDDEDLEVKVMYKIGQTQYFGPLYRISFGMNMTKLFANTRAFSDG
jgi:hypothetical protein